MMDFVSVNDELQALKLKAREYGKEIIRIEKAGNANMSAFKVFYKNNNEDTIRETFFWRHAMDRLIAQFASE